MRTWNSNIMLNGREDMIEQIRELCKEYAEGLFDRAILFGSTARGENTDKSDIDIYIESRYLTGTKLLTNRKFVEFRLKLYDVTNDTIEFDLLSYGRNELKSIRNSLLYQQVEKDGVILYDQR